MGLDPTAGGCATFAFITVLPILNFTIQTQQKMAFFARRRGNGGDLYAPATSLLATGRRAHLSWYIWVVDWLDRAGFTPVTRHLALRGFAGWGYFLAGKLAHCALCLILPWLLSDFSFMTILLTYLLSQLLASLIL